MSVKYSRFLKRALILVMVSLLLAGLQSAAMAKILQVPGASPTIKGAMIKAKTGDLILVSCGTYREHDIQVKPGVSLWSGDLQPDCVTIDTGGQGRAFIFVNVDSTTALVGFTIINGRMTGEGENGQGGAILCLNSSPRLSSCLLSNNTAQRGGAIFCDASSNPKLENCLLQDNTALQAGGALCIDGGSARLFDCGLMNNLALIGGGLACYNTQDVLIKGSSISSNEAGNSGGGMYFRNALARLTHTVIADNWGGLGGGGLTSVNCEPELIQCTLYGNSAEIDGAAVACVAQAPTLENCIVSHSRQSLLRTDSAVPHFSGSNLFANQGGNWQGRLAGQARQRKNFSVDPNYCAAQYGNYHVSSNSACLPANNPRGNSSIVGALGEGCSASKVSSVPPAATRSFRAVNAGF